MNIKNNDNNFYVAFIPARSGSKGIPHKNVTTFRKHPLILHTLKAVQQSPSINHIALSTDSHDIIELFKREGHHEKYIRPGHLAEDHSSLFECVYDYLNFYSEQYLTKPTHIILLQPTSPLRNSRHINECIALAEQTNAPFVVSVHEMIEHPTECVFVQNNNQHDWHYLVPPTDGHQRQNYSNNYFFINGCIYIAQVEALLEHKKFCVENKTVFYKMPSYFGIDIDDYTDLKMAEAMGEWIHEKSLS